MKMPPFGRARALAGLAAGVCLLALGGRMLLHDDAGARSGSTPLTAVAPTPSTGDEPTPPGDPPIVVHVVGAVRRPGLYQLAPGSRVADAVEEAGGPTRRAMLASLNLAAPLADGQQVIVPARGARAEPTGIAPAASAPGVPAGPLHLNTATLEQLDGLPGVGPVTAQRIIDYRDAHGPFAAVEELDAIPGIGPARLEQLRELVTP